MKAINHNKTKIYFSSGGFNFGTTLGVAYKIQKFGNLKQFKYFYGESAGAWVAACLVCGVCTKTLFEIFPFDKNIDGLTIIEYAKYLFLKSFPIDAYKKADGKLFIAVTQIPEYEKKYLSKFESNKDLMESLCCSITIPIFSGILAYKYKDIYYSDGGMIKSSLDDESTLYVSTNTEVSVDPRKYDIYGLGKNNIFDSLVHKSKDFSNKSFHYGFNSIL